MKNCMRCAYCNLNKTNDISQVWCIKFNTFINLFDICDYFSRNTDLS